MRSQSSTALLPAALLVSLLCAEGASAQPLGLEVASARSGQIKVDGDLGEWRGVRARTFGDDDSSSFDLRLAFDSTGLFVGASCHDDKLVRTAQLGAADDALVVDLALVEGERLRTSEVRLFAGEMGRSKARVMLSVDGARVGVTLAEPARIVEGPLDGGYVIEAFVPWSALPGGENHRFARARVSMLDVDRPGGAQVEVATAREQAAERWPWLLLEGGPVAHLAGFLRDKSLNSTPAKLDRLVDIRGDARTERVMVVGSFVVVSDSDGGFAYVDLPVTHAADVRSAVLAPRATDGRPELLLGLRKQSDDGATEAAHVVDITGPTPVVRMVPPPAPPPVAPKNSDRPGTKRAVVTEVPQTIIHLEPPGTDALVAEYRRVRGIPDGVTPRWVQHCNFAEDERIESLLLFGRELLVVGDGFQGGAGFFYFGLPVREGADVYRMFTGDVTGDGRREVFVRVRQLIAEVQRELLLVYTYDGGGLAPLLQVEVRRARGAQSVGNIVRLVRSGPHYALEIDPGFAHGWSESDYPYVRDSGDGVAPLLLPWADRKTRYVFDGHALRPTSH